MNADVKALWVAALRSGDYEQGSRALHEWDTYCCLGVLCEIATKAINLPITIADGRSRRHQYGPDLEGSVLPAEVVKWAGLTHQLGSSVVIAGVAEVLTRHNDAGATFAQIADAIEAQL